MLSNKGCLFFFIYEIWVASIDITFEKWFIARFRQSLTSVRNWIGMEILVLCLFSSRVHPPNKCVPCLSRESRIGIHDFYYAILFDCIDSVQSEREKFIASCIWMVRMWSFKWLSPPYERHCSVSFTKRLEEAKMRRRKNSRACHKRWHSSKFQEFMVFRLFVIQRCARKIEEVWRKVCGSEMQSITIELWGNWIFLDGYRFTGWFQPSASSRWVQRETSNSGAGTVKMGGIK